MNIQKALKKDVLRSLKSQLGDDLVSFIITGSRANGDYLEDSDFDAFAFAKSETDGSIKDTDKLEKRYGIRVGISLMPVERFYSWVEGKKLRFGWTGVITLLSMKLGQARVAAGRDLIAEIPTVSKLLKRDMRTELRADYKYATRKGSPANVLAREPRRHVGYIISACNAILLSKGIAVRKSRLPSALKRHFPELNVADILRRALSRRKHWQEIGDETEVQKAARADLKAFLAIYRDFLWENR